MSCGDDAGAWYNSPYFCSGKVASLIQQHALPDAFPEGGGSTTVCKVQQAAVTSIDLSNCTIYFEGVCTINITEGSTIENLAQCQFGSGAVRDGAGAALANAMLKQDSAFRTQLKTNLGVLTDQGKKALTAALDSIDADSSSETVYSKLDVRTQNLFDSVQECTINDTLEANVEIDNSIIVCDNSSLTLSASVVMQGASCLLQSGMQALNALLEANDTTVPAPAPTPTPFPYFTAIGVPALAGVAVALIIFFVARYRASTA